MQVENVYLDNTQKKRNICTVRKQSYATFDMTITAKALMILPFNQLSKLRCGEIRADRVSVSDEK